MSGPRTLLLGLTLSIAGVLCTSAMRAQSQTRAGCDGNSPRDMKPCLQTFVDDETVIGLVTLVETRGQAQVDAVGQFRPDSIFQIMSMSKPFVAAGIMMLVDQGKIPSVDSKVSALQGFESFPYPAVTIRQLLTHTSGMWFKREIAPGTWHGIEPLLTDAFDKAPGTTARDKPLGAVASHYANAQLYPLDAAARQFHYSNIGYLMLGWVIERLSGQPLEDFMRTKLFEPLQMKDTFYFAERASAGQRARIAALDRRRPDPPDYKHYDPLRPGFAYASPAGGIYSTADDLRKFLSLFRNDGRTPGGARLLGHGSIVKLRTDEEPGDDFGCKGAFGRSLGFVVVRKEGCPGAPAYSPGTIFHRGRFSTEFWFDPVQDRIGITMYQRVESEDYAFPPRRYIQELIKRFPAR